MSTLYIRLERLIETRRTEIVNRGLRIEIDGTTCVSFQLAFTEGFCSQRYCISDRLDQLRCLCVVAVDVTDVARSDIVGPIGIVHFARGIDRITKVKIHSYCKAAGRIKIISEAANILSTVVSLLQGKRESMKHLETQDTGKLHGHNQVSFAIELW